MKEYKVQPLDLMQYINSKYHEPFIHELIEFESKPDITQLKTSIEKLLITFPLLKSCYSQKDNVFIENDELKIDDIFQTVDNAETNSLLTESLDITKQLIKFSLCDNTLYITMCHMVCDGVGFKQLLYLLSDLYNEKEVDTSYLLNREFSQLTQNIKMTMSVTMKMLFSMLGGYKNKKIYEKSDDNNIYVIQSTIDKDTMTKVHDKAKKLGVTLNDVFMTAFARSQSSLYHLEKINIPCTVDLRKYASLPTGIANLTGTYNLNVKIDENETFYKSLEKVNEKMRQLKASKNDIAGPLLLVEKYNKSSLEKFLKTYGGMNTSAFTDYTNLGVIDDNKLTFKDLKIKTAIGYSGLNKAPYFQLAVSSFKGETTLTSLFTSSKTESIKAKNLLETTVKEIIAFSK